MKPRTIKDAYGDNTAVEVSCFRRVRVVIGPPFAMHYTVEQSRELRKALKRAEREIEAGS
jgi:hypothetical protein